MFDVARPRAWLLWIAAFIALVGTVYGRTIGFGYVAYDDPIYAGDNPHVRAGVTLAGARWAAVDVSTGNWHPVTWLSLMADESIGGGPATHHAVNVALHLANTILVFLLLVTTTRRIEAAGWTAALFAVHPLHVESVAWISERKDVLCAFFGLLSLAAFDCARRSGRTGWSLAAILAFGASLMSKPMLVTMPLLLLVWSAWPSSTHPEAAGSRRGGSWLALAPFAVLAAAAGATALASQAGAKAVASIETLTIGDRLGNALVAYEKYLQSTFWPHRLTPLYGFPRGGYPWPTVLGAVVSLGLLLLAAAAARRRAPWITFGIVWYLIALLPVLGLVQIGAQARADRYLYLPILGPLVAAVWSVRWAVDGRGRGARLGARLAGTGAVVFLASMAFSQTGIWGDSVALFRKAVAVEPANARAHHALGIALRGQGNTAGGLLELRRSVELAPWDVKLRRDLSSALVEADRTVEASAQLEEALSYDPQNVGLLVDAGRLRVAVGDVAGGAARIDAALGVAPRDPYALKWRGAALIRAGRHHEALTALSTAAAFNPEDQEIQRWIRALVEAESGGPGPPSPAW